MFIKVGEPRWNLGKRVWQPCIVYGLEGDIPSPKTLEWTYSPFFDDFDRSRENLSK
jgi:hypothetical protein